MSAARLRERVVVPVDFSEESYRAIDASLEEVDDPSHVYVIHILPPLEPAEPGVVWETIDDSMRCKHAEKFIKEKLSDDKYRGIVIEVRVGQPGHEIVDYADQIKANLIVLPSHGRTGVRRLLLGSVAERVIRLAHCPILVLKRPASP